MCFFIYFFNFVQETNMARLKALCTNLRKGSDNLKKSASLIEFDVINVFNSENLINYQDQLKL